MTALHLLQDLKSKAPGGNRIAREIAILLGDACYRPDVITHTPGVANVLADFLSRWMMPDKRHLPLPQHLSNATKVSPPVRTRSFYIADGPWSRC